MIVAGVVVQTVPRAAETVAVRLRGVPGFQIHGDDGDSRIATVWTGASGEELEALGESLVERDPEILGIYPTFAGDDREG